MGCTRHALTLAVGASLALTAIAAAVPPGRSANTSAVRQELLSRSPSGDAPNGPAGEPVFSWDGRAARYVAYTSSATNIRRGTDGHRNVFIVRRGGGALGGPWQIGSTTLASAGIGGRPADGDSFSPALGGYSSHDTPRGPSCLAFVSEASNLVAGDDNGHADVFVRKLGSGRLTRIAAPGRRPASEVAVSGHCHTILLVAGGALYAKRGRAAVKRLAGGGVSSPRSTLNGKGVTYTRGDAIYAGSISGRVRPIASGSAPAPDAGHPSNPGLGRVRYVSYRRAGSIFYRRIGGFDRHVAVGTAAQPTAGGGQVVFGAEHFVYLYAVSNDFGKKAPQGYCPPGTGDVTGTYPSARGNYIAFACSAGGIYVSYVGDR